MHFADKLNCFVGLNGQGKTNILDAIYLLSFTKSAYNAVDSMNITHGEEMAMVQGVYREGTLSNSPLKGENQKSPLQGDLEGLEPITITCGMKRGQKKQFRNGKKDYKRMVDHIGLLPLVMVSPQDGRLIEDGSEERRRFLDVVISQHNKEYLNRLNTYNALLKQRNALLKEEGDPLHLPLQRGREDNLPSSNETNLSPSHPEVPTSNAPWGGPVGRDGEGPCPLSLISLTNLC